MRFIYLVSCLLAVACSSTRLAVNARIEVSTAIDELSLKQLEKSNFPGLAVAVFLKGEKVYTSSYGYADIETTERIKTDQSFFRIGSISKTLTASVLCEMAERGDIDLDVPIQQYLPDFPTKDFPITLRQIAGHIAGIRHYNGMEFLSNIQYNNIDDAMSIFKNDSLLFEPGTKYSYSTYGWTIISAAMEAASGKSFLDLMHDELIEDGNLAAIVPDENRNKNLRRVTFYLLNDRQNIVAPAVNNSNKWAGGGYLGTAEEVARFGVLHTKPGYLSSSALSTCVTSQKLRNGESTNYGIGFRSGEDNAGRLWYGHSGGSVGGTSMLLIYPKEELVVVTLVNQSGAKMDNLAWRIADVLLDE